MGFREQGIPSYLQRALLISMYPYESPTRLWWFEGCSICSVTFAFLGLMSAVGHGPSSTWLCAFKVI